MIISCTSEKKILVKNTEDKQIILCSKEIKKKHLSHNNEKQFRVKNCCGTKMILYVGKGKNYIPNHQIVLKEYSEIPPNSTTTIIINLKNNEKAILVGNFKEKDGEKTKNCYTEYNLITNDSLKDTNKIFTFTKYEDDPPFNSKFISNHSKISQKIEFVGAGEIQKSFSEEKEVPASTGLGIYYERNMDCGYVKKMELEAVINIASTVDTIFAKYNSTTKEINNRRDFGNYLMSPTISGQSTSIHYRLYINELYNKRVIEKQRRPWICGWDIQLAVSNRVWSNSNDSIKKSVHASGLSIKGGPFYEFIPHLFNNNEEKGNETYSASVGVNVSYRMLLGDVSQNNQKAFRKELTGVKNIYALGIEPNFVLRLNNIRAEAAIPILFNLGDKNTGLPGLTGIQFVTTIKFIGGFPLK